MSIVSNKVIKVQFSQGDSHMAANESAQQLYHREYDYFYVDADKVVVKGSYAVVEASGCMKIVKVIGVGKFAGKATKYAITVFNIEEHQQRIETAKQIEELKESILARAAESRRMKELAILAETDSVLAGMLSELQALENGS